MRIALFTDTYPPTVNGVARTLGRLVHHLHLRGHQVGLISPTVSPEPAEGVAFHHQLPGVPIPMYPELQLAWPMDRPGLRLLEEFQPDLVHIATESTIGWAGRRWARKRQIPLVSSFHTDWPAYVSGYGFGGLESPVQRALQLFHGPARITFCPSTSTREQLRRWGFTHDLRIWSRGVDTDHFSPERRRDDLRAAMAPGAEKILLYVGRLAPEKRVGVLFDAFPLIRKALGSSVALVLVGDGPWMERLKGNAPEGVHFLGYRTGIPLAEAYASGDVFAFPSDTETFGNVVTEALASGLPVIAPAKGGVLDSVLPGRTGCLFSPGDAKEMAEVAIRLLTDAERMSTLAHGAREHALARSWEVILDRLLEDYREALDGKGPSG